MSDTKTQAASNKSSPLDSAQLLDRYYPEMRWRCLSLAADLDRIERATGGAALLSRDPRLSVLREGINLLLKTGATRAENLQNLLSDKTPPPNRA